MNLREDQKIHHGYMPVLINDDGSVSDFLQMPMGAMAIVFESKAKAMRLLSEYALPGQLRGVLPVKVTIEIDES